MDQIEIILPHYCPSSGKVTEKILAKFACWNARKKRMYFNIPVSALIRSNIRFPTKERCFPLTETYEFQTFVYLASQPGRVYTKEQIYRAVWKEEPVDVSSAVFCDHRRISRQKLREVTTKEYIQTVWGVGYKFVDVPGE